MGDKKVTYNDEDHQKLIRRNKARKQRWLRMQAKHYEKTKQILNPPSHIKRIQD